MHHGGFRTWSRHGVFITLRYMPSRSRAPEDAIAFSRRLFPESDLQHVALHKIRTAGDCDLVRRNLELVAQARVVHAFHPAEIATMIAAIPEVDNDAAIAPIVGVLEHDQLRRLFDEFPFAEKTQIVTDPIFESTIDLARMTPEVHRTTSLNAFAIFGDLRETVHPMPYDICVMAAKAKDTKTPRDELKRLFLASDYVAFTAARNPALVPEDIRELATSGMWSAYFLMCNPNCPPEVADQLLRDRKVYGLPEFPIYASEAVTDLLLLNYRGDTWAPPDVSRFPRASGSCLLQLHQDNLDEYGAVKNMICAGKLFSHPNFPVEIAEQFVLAALRDPVLVGICSAIPNDMFSLWARHPRLSLAARQEVYIETESLVLDEVRRLLDEPVDNDGIQWQALRNLHLDDGLADVVAKNRSGVPVQPDSDDAENIRVLEWLDNTGVLNHEDIAALAQSGSNVLRIWAAYPHRAGHIAIESPATQRLMSLAADLNPFANLGVQDANPNVQLLSGEQHRRRSLPLGIDKFAQIPTSLGVARPICTLDEYEQLPPRSRQEILDYYFMCPHNTEYALVTIGKNRSACDVIIFAVRDRRLELEQVLDTRTNETLIDLDRLLPLPDSQRLYLREVASVAADLVALFMDQGRGLL